jgi:hypothetical protein
MIGLYGLYCRVKFTTVNLKIEGLQKRSYSSVRHCYNDFIEKIAAVATLKGKYHEKVDEIGT